MLWKQSVLLTHLYNQFLEKKIEAYKSKGITLSRYDLQKLLPQLKKEHPAYKEIHSQVLQQVPKRLNDTYNSFFKRKFGFPNFRASRFFFGLVYPQNTGCRLQNGKVLWGKEKIRMSEHIPIPSTSFLFYQPEPSCDTSDTIRNGSQRNEHLSLMIYTLLTYTNI